MHHTDEADRTFLSAVGCLECVLLPLYCFSRSQFQKYLFCSQSSGRGIFSGRDVFDIEISDLRPVGCQIRPDFFLLSSLLHLEDLLCINHFPEVKQSFSSTGELVLIALLCGSVPARLEEVIWMANLVAVHCKGFSACGTQIEFQRWELVWRAGGLRGKGTPSVWEGGTHSYITREICLGLFSVSVLFSGVF